MSLAIIVPVPSSYCYNIRLISHQNHLHHGLWDTATPQGIIFLLNHIPLDFVTSSRHVEQLLSQAYPLASDQTDTACNSKAVSMMGISRKDGHLPEMF